MPKMMGIYTLQLGLNPQTDIFPGRRGSLDKRDFDKHFMYDIQKKDNKEEKC